MSTLYCTNVRPDERIKEIFESMKYIDFGTNEISLDGTNGIILFSRNQHPENGIRLLAEKFPEVAFEVAFCGDDYETNSGFYDIHVAAKIWGSHCDTDISVSEENKREILSRTWGMDLFTNESIEEIHIYKCGNHILKCSSSDEDYFTLIHYESLTEEDSKFFLRNSFDFEIDKYSYFREMFNESLETLKLPREVQLDFTLRIVETITSEQLQKLLMTEFHNAITEFVSTSSWEVEIQYHEEFLDVNFSVVSPNGVQKKIHTCVDLGEMSSMLETIKEKLDTQYLDYNPDTEAMLLYDQTKLQGSPSQGTLQKYLNDFNWFDNQLRYLSENICLTPLDSL